MTDSIQIRSRLKECEEIIEKGLQTFIEVGNALLEIRDSKLYKLEYGTFEDYCRERWGMVSRRARQLIMAAEVVGNIESGTIVPLLPQTESQTRPLTKLEPELQPHVWQEVLKENDPESITAKVIEAKVNGFIPINEALKEIKNESIPTILNPDPPKYEDLIQEAESRAGKMKIHYSSESPEWYTPNEIINSVLDVFGEIDLDPCSDSKESPNTPALNHFTKEDDGLSKDWIGRVYINPPYGREISDWIDKAVNEYQRGNISQAILLLPARTDTSWMQKLRNYPRCFVCGRLKFSGYDTSAPFPNVIVYMGQDIDLFVKIFSPHGDVYGLLKSADEFV